MSDIVKGVEAGRVPGPTGFPYTSLEGDSPCGNVEITFVGSFPLPNAWTPQRELQQINAGNWMPGVEDFKAVARHEKQKFYEAQSFSEFLGTIQNEGGLSKKRIIKRINIVTHAMSNLIAFSGAIDATSGGVALNNAGAWDDPNKGLDIQALNDLHNPDLSAFLIELRDKFCKDAVVYFYACNSGQGVNLALFQDFARTFQVKVRGFGDAVWYGPTKTLPIDRNFTALGPPPPANPPATFQRGFKHMDSSANKSASP